MAIVRIFQIAKELNISHTDIVDFLNKKGLDVKSHMSVSYTHLTLPTNREV